MSRPKVECDQGWGGQWVWQCWSGFDAEFEEPPNCEVVGFSALRVSVVSCVGRRLTVQVVGKTQIRCQLVQNHGGASW